MSVDLERAKNSLLAHSYTCVLCRDGALTVSEHRGVAPLLEWLETGISPGFCAADKVVGRATAYLYCLLGAKAVHGRVMSEPALQVLRQHGITAQYETLVRQIRNRQNTGSCPMEAATADCQTPEHALAAIREALKNLQS